MNNDPISKGIGYLAQTQSDDGSFASAAVAGTDTLNTPTPFATSLVLTALAPLSDRLPKKMIGKATSFLKSQFTNTGSVNYWKVGSPNRITTPYPDDLDDTSLSLAALLVHARSSVDGGLLANFIKTLSEHEHAPGGPYNTWCCDIENDPKWKDCDMAVNANIGYALRLIGVELPSLVELAHLSLLKKSYKSSYYISPLTTLYFISRMQDRSLATVVKNEVLELHTKAGHWGTPLATALALSTLYHSGESLKQYKKEITYLKKSQHKDGHWSAEPFYIERSIGSVTWYWQSDAWTTAAVLETLALADIDTTKQSLPEYKAIQTRTVAHVIKRAQVFPFASQIIEYGEHVQKSRTGSDALLLPFRFRDALGISINQYILEQLSQAHLFGWIGYTLLDRVVDQEVNHSYAPALVWSVRQHMRVYQDLLDQKMYSRIETILAQSEAAQAAEVTTGMSHTDTTVVLDDIPYTYTPSTKSLGHALPCIAIMLLLKKESKIKDIQGYFAAILGATQLNDDMHDVVEDLRVGRRTLATMTVVRSIKDREPGRTELSFPKDEPLINEVFWCDAFDTLDIQMKKYIHQAQRHLRSLKLKHSDYFEDQITSISRRQETARSERDLMRQFLQAY